MRTSISTHDHLRDAAGLVYDRYRYWRRIHGSTGELNIEEADLDRAMDFLGVVLYPDPEAKPVQDHLPAEYHRWDQGPVGDHGLTRWTCRNCGGTCRINFLPPAGPCPGKPVQEIGVCRYCTRPVTLDSDGSTWMGPDGTAFCQAAVGGEHSIAARKLKLGFVYGEDESPVWIGSGPRPVDPYEPEAAGSEPEVGTESRTAPLLAPTAGEHFQISELVALEYEIRSKLNLQPWAILAPEGWYGYSVDLVSLYGLMVLYSPKVSRPALVLQPPTREEKT